MNWNFFCLNLTYIYEALICSYDSSACLNEERSFLKVRLLCFAHRILFRWVSWLRPLLLLLFRIPRKIRLSSIPCILILLSLQMILSFRILRIASGVLLFSPSKTRLIHINETFFFNKDPYYYSLYLICNFLIINMQLRFSKNAI